VENLNVPLISIPNVLHIGEKLGIDSSGYILSYNSMSLFFKS
jgi:hypothetical protein